MLPDELLLDRGTFSKGVEDEIFHRVQF
jgi:hypothetical protein